jgi:dolichol-phosphate mannosyltransferase
MHSTPPIISLVIPFLNEEAVLPKLFLRLSEELARIPGYHWELILVDDGSTDQSWAVISQLSSQNPHTKGIRFSRNFGQHYAITAGCRLAAGQWIVVMDADLQDDPAEIPNLYKKAKEGYQVVLAARTRRGAV